MPRRAALLLAGALACSAEEIPPDPCEPLLAASRDRAAWPGLVVDVPRGDTLRVQVKSVGLRTIRLAGLRAPDLGEPLGQVSRFHLARLAKGLRIFLVLEPPPGAWPSEVIALVEDFAEAQLEAGMGWYRPEEEALLGAYVSCRCRTAAERARAAARGVWTP